MTKSGTKRSFNARAFVSLTLAVGFLITMFAGLILYLTPHGRVANWTGWSVLGLGKEQWGEVHMTGSALFVSMAVVHLIYNWKPLLAYLRRKAKEGPGMRWEPVAALAVGLLFLTGTVQEWPPFHSVVTVNTSVKGYWEARAAQAPRPHAEELTIAAYAEEIGMRPEGVMRRLNEAGIQVDDSSEKLRSVADRHGLAPSDLHAAIGVGHGTGDGQGRGMGTGNGQGRGMGEGHGEGRGGDHAPPTH